jgi:HAL2 family 3'(2'),5'-bisphosphate nucleotidase
MTDLRKERLVGIDAVRAAARVCRAVQKDLVNAETLEKKDKSPVTVADFASQAIVCQRLQSAFPADPVVGEEDARALRAAGQEVLRASVTRHVNAEIETTADSEQVLAWIDRGRAEPSVRFWTLDPIDGTKGFLRAEQYAVALALIEGGEVVLGVLGCPNLPDGRDGTGALFTATRGGPAHALRLWDDADTGGEPISVARLASAAEARFCESVESGHSDQGESAEIARLLGISAPPYRIDSQCKYGVVARGDASIYLRMPTRADYREKIWDHAAGKLVVEAAGGRVTDVNGEPLDFRQGRTLERNRGVVATNGAIHDEVLEAVRKVRKSKS